MAGQAAIARALAIAVDRRVPVLLWGSPGSGKSAVVNALGASLGVRVETVIASLREPADFAGLPILTSDGTVSLAAPSWAKRLTDAGGGLLFLDEVTTAPPAVQAALLRVVLERVVGDVELAADVAVVAAANPPEEAAGGWELSAPLANRFCHLDWPVDPAAYVQALSAGWPVPELPTGRAADRGGASPSAARVNGALAGFLRGRPALVHAMPADAATGGRAWPSPRTWDLARTLWAAAEDADAGEEVALLLVSGCVGPGAARELFVWRTDADLPDPEKILASPSTYRLPDRGDRQFAVLSALAAAVAANCTAERWYAAFEIIEQASRRGAPDIAAIAARTLAANMPAGLTALPDALSALAPVMRSAGLLRRRRE